MGLNHGLDLAMEIEEENWWQPAPYKLVLLPEYVDEKKKWKANPKTVNKLYRAGYCLDHAKRYVLLAHIFNFCPIAKGSLEFLEEHQKKLEAAGLRTKIIFQDVGMKAHI
jgi:hypothetical protein